MIQIPRYYQKRLFYCSQSPEIFEPKTKKWSRWQPPPNVTKGDCCLISWRDQFIVLGGFSTRLTVQIYDHQTSAWISVQSPPPFEIVKSGCVLIPGTDQILVAGSRTQPYSSALYNITAQSWTLLANSSVAKYKKHLVALGSRIFSIGNLNNSITEEFHLTSHSWTQLDVVPTSLPEGFSGALALPAEMFKNLPDGCDGVL